VIKNTDPAGSPQQFHFTTTGTGYTAGFSLTDYDPNATPPGPVNDSGELLPGAYSVTEDAVSGWEPGTPICTSSKGDTEVNTALDLNPGETITCEFTNEENASITVIKTTSNGEGGTFTYVSDFSVPNLTVPGGAGNLHTFTSGDLDPTTYSVVETVPAGWVLTNDNGTAGVVVCSDLSPSDAIVLAAGEHVSCTFNNELQIGSIRIHKQSVKTTEDENGDPVNIPLVGVSFTVNGETKATDAFGNVCFDRLPFDPVTGTSYSVTETVPGGFVGETIPDVLVDNVSYCDGTGGGASESITVNNTPKTNITVSVDSQVIPDAGGTESTIECTPVDPPEDGQASTDPATGDGSLTVNDLLPGTYTCTIVIDP
jgi:hypothetical protein